MNHDSSGPNSRREIFLLEHERDLRETLKTALTEAGYQVVCFADSSALLSLARDRIPACILLDAYVPIKSGLELLKKLQADRYPAPMLIMCDRADVTTAVSAIKLGALDVIERPFRGSEIIARITEAIDSYMRRRGEGGSIALGPLHLPRHRRLSKREHEILEVFVSGATAKETARALGISPRTVEDHRMSIMRKLRAKNSADLMRIVMTAARNSS